jgi:hypothetical protein
MFWEFSVKYNPYTLRAIIHRLLTLQKLGKNITSVSFIGNVFGVHSNEIRELYVTKQFYM